MSRIGALRVSSEDFPTPTAISVAWPDAGVVFFVDVCRSQYETAPPSVWMLDQPTLPENNNNNNTRDPETSSITTEEEEENNSTELFTLQVSKASSVSFRCSYFVPKIVNNNVLVLLIGDAYATAASSSATSNNNNNNNSSPHSHASGSITPFFGVCASLLPPPELVRQHGVEAFASFSFAWLCGPEITSMRPAPRVAFACTATSTATTTTAAEKSNRRHTNNNESSSSKPNASIWIHGGLPLAPTTTLEKTNSHNNNKSYFEPLTIFPDQYSDSDIFLVGSSNNNNNNLQHADKYLRKSVTEDFYGMFELKLCIIGNSSTSSTNQNNNQEEEGSVSVYPWIRHPGLPLICHHSISSVELPTTNLFSSSSSSSSSRKSKNSQKLFLIIFGGLKLDLWKSQRSSDLLPTFRNNEFTISNTFYIYDVEEENWEWKDAVITSTSTSSSSSQATKNNNSNNQNPSDTEVAAALIKTAISAAEKFLEIFQQQQQQNQNDSDYSSSSSSFLSLVGSRPPPVFDHKIIEIFLHENNNTNNTVLKSFLVYGGLRGRFTEKSKEIWSFGTNSKTRLIQCSQQTAPPTINNTQNQNQSSSSADSNNNIDHQHLFFLFNRIWAIDLKKKIMWCQKIDEEFFVENNNSILVSSFSSSQSPTRNLNFGGSRATGGKYPWEGPVNVVSGTLRKQNRNSRGRSLDFENPPPMIVQMNYPHHHPLQKQTNGEESIEREENQRQQRLRREGASSPGTTNALMDAFEF